MAGLHFDQAISHRQVAHKERARLKLALAVGLFATGWYTCYWGIQTHPIKPPISMDAGDEKKGDVLVQKACREFVVPLDTDCPRFLEYSHTSAAGFGHQFMEMLFGLNKARALRLTYQYQPFNTSTWHGDNYAVLDNLLGLSNLFEAVTFTRSPDRDTLLNQLPRQELTPAYANRCGVVYTIGGYHHCQSAPNGDCFSSPDNRYLFQDTSECLRAGVSAFGIAFDKCVLIPHAENISMLPSDEIYVVIHVRVGDIDLHKPDDRFYKTLLTDLKDITAGYRLRILLVGKGIVDLDGRSNVSSEYLDTIKSRAFKIWNSTAVHESVPIISAPKYTFQDAFLAMMQADILVGSGSSLPAVASLVSGVPLFFNHVAKHGYNFGAEMVANDVDLGADGHVLESHRRLQVEVHKRMRAKQSTACRKGNKQPS